ncbi:MAG: hypothetical protein AcusKO_14710 [Acuticoccus sp.]
MARNPTPLRQSDLARYARAMRSSGVAEWRVEIEPSGKVIIVVGTSEPPVTPNPCDELLK